MVEIGYLLMCLMMLWSTATGITMCDPADGGGIVARYQGQILSPSYTNQTRSECSVELTGIPTRSWFQLYVNSKNLPLPCDSNYISIERTDSIICGSSRDRMIHQYKDHEGPVTVKFTYEQFTPPLHSFNLTYTVAAVIDLPPPSSIHSVNLEGKNNGFVVSHYNHSRVYRNNINSTLTLTNLSSNSISLKFFSLTLPFCKCCARLTITTADTYTNICANRSNRTAYLGRWVYFQTIHQQITFHFITGSERPGRGFKLQYKVGANPDNQSTYSPHTVANVSSPQTPETPTMKPHRTSTEGEPAPEDTEKPNPRTDKIYIWVGVASCLVLAIASAIVLVIIRKRMSRGVKSYLERSESPSAAHTQAIELTDIAGSAHNSGVDLLEKYGSGHAVAYGVNGQRQPLRSAAATEVRS